MYNKKLEKLINNNLICNYEFCNINVATMNLFEIMFNGYMEYYNFQKLTHIFLPHCLYNKHSKIKLIGCSVNIGYYGVNLTKQYIDLGGYLPSRYRHIIFGWDKINQNGILGMC